MSDIIQAQKKIIEILSKIEEEFTQICIENRITKKQGFLSFLNYLKKNTKEEVFKEIESFNEELKALNPITINRNTFAFISKESEKEMLVFIRESKFLESFKIAEYMYLLQVEENTSSTKIKELIKKILLPRYFIEKERENYIEQRAKALRFREITKGLKNLKEKIDSFDLSQEKFNIDKKDVHSLNLFFKLLESEDKKIFLQLNTEWQALDDLPIRIIRLYCIYSIFFPKNIKLEDLNKDIDKILNSSDDKILEDVTFSYEHITTSEEPLYLSLDEVYFIFNAVFEIKANKNTVLNYIKEINLKLKKVGRGYRPNYKDLKHPFLDGENRKNFIKTLCSEKKSYSENFIEAKNIQE